MKKLFYLFFVLSCISCSDKIIEENFYKSGNLKSILIYTKDSVLIDSSIYYYDQNSLIKTIKFWEKGTAYYQKDYFKNGKVKREGNLLKDNFRIGNWKLYSQEGALNEMIEYLDIAGVEYINQSWKISKNHDTIGGNYYKLIRMKDTINYSGVNRLHFFLEQPLFEKSETFILIPRKGEQLESNFSNEESVKWDTINNMAIEFSQHPIYKNWKYDVLFDIAPRKKGNDTLKGIILEREKSESGKEGYDFVTRKIYFRLPYFSE